jgi:hypothetical protein
VALLVERMRNAKVKGLDMELRNFHPARLDVSQYDDVKAITNFLMRHWDIRDLGDPIGRARLEEDVKRNYARGMQAGGSIFEEEFRKPPYDLVHGERFYKDSEKLLALAEKAIKRKKIK